MGAQPWGARPLENVGAVTEPRRKLAIDLASPYLTCFDGALDIRYDVQPRTARRIGWYRFAAPPGVKKLRLNTTVPAKVWVDGVRADVHEGIARVAQPPSGVSTVAVRLEMEPGTYGGAAFGVPIGLELESGTIRPGLWSDFALPTYSGIGVYRQTVNLTATEARRPMVLDLGQVLVAAEVFVNDRSSGVRLARPFKFDLRGLVREGENAIEIHVANTIAPHYTVTNEVRNLGPTDSGLLGPVVLRQKLPPDEWVAWAKSEVARLRKQLDTSTPELEARQRQWKKTPGWTALEWKKPSESDSSLSAETDLIGVTGFRIEMLSADDTTADDATAPIPAGGQLEIVATRPGNVPFAGRYVRVQLVDRHEFLHMAEVQVFSGAKNVAPAGRASQSSSHPEAPAALAIDGNTNGSWGAHSVSHTGSEQNPWWEVDLGSVMPVNRIAIFNRTDGDLENRLDSFRVSLLDESRAPVWQQAVTDPPDPSLTLHLSPAPVRLSGVDPATDREPDEGSRFTWQASGPDGRRRVAVFQAGESVGFPGGTVLNFRLALGVRKPNTAGRLRISATTMPGPLVDVPPQIAQLMGTPLERRTARQRAAVAAFYRSIAPELCSARQRLAELQGQLVP